MNHPYPHVQGECFCDCPMVGGVSTPSSPVAIFPALLSEPARLTVSRIFGEAPNTFKDNTFFNLPVIESDYCPPGKMFVLNTEPDHYGFTLRRWSEPAPASATWSDWDIDAIMDDISGLMDDCIRRIAEDAVREKRERQVSILSALVFCLIVLAVARVLGWV